MNLSEIRLPNFPKYAKNEYGVVKFFSPFHCLIVEPKEIAIDENNDYESVLVQWTRFINEEFEAITQAEFDTAYTEAIQKLSNL